MTAHRSCRTSSDGAVLCRRFNPSKGAHIALIARHGMQQQIVPLHVRVNDCQGLVATYSEDDGRRSLV